MRKSLRAALASAFFGLAVTYLASFGTGCIGAEDGICEAGEHCHCDGIGACDYECGGRDCRFYCEGIGSCNFACPEGGCFAYCQGEGSCAMSCPGGGCTLYCEGTGSCELKECAGNGCEMICQVTGSCTES